MNRQKLGNAARVVKRHNPCPNKTRTRRLSAWTNGVRREPLLEISALLPKKRLCRRPKSRRNIRKPSQTVDMAAFEVPASSGAASSSRMNSPMRPMAVLISSRLVA